MEKKLIISSAARIIFISAVLFLLLAFSLLFNNSRVRRSSVEAKVDNGFMKKAIEDIESRIAREEKEYNEAKESEELKKRQYDILAFEHSLTLAERSAQDALIKQEDSAKLLNTGRITLSVAKESAVFAKGQCEKAKKEIKFIQVPPYLSPETIKQLEEAKKGILAAYDKKTEAMESFSEMIYSDDPAEINKYDESMKLSRIFYSDALLNIIEAKKRNGLELENKAPR